jgi:Flp pilus assembly protein TadG
VSDRGSASAELVICTPVLLLLAVVAMTIGHLVLDHAQVVDVARAAAEAASTWPTAGEATSAAEAAATYEITRDGLPCASPIVSVDTVDLVPGGTVEVAVTCVVRLGAAGVPGLPGSVTIEASAVAPIETYREVG